MSDEVKNICHRSQSANAGEAASWLDVQKLVITPNGTFHRWTILTLPNG